MLAHMGIPNALPHYGHMALFRAQRCGVSTAQGESLHKKEDPGEATEGLKDVPLPFQTAVLRTRSDTVLRLLSAASYLWWPRAPHPCLIFKSLPHLLKLGQHLRTLLSEVGAGDRWRPNRCTVLNGRAGLATVAMGSTQPRALATSGKTPSMHAAGVW